MSDHRTHWQPGVEEIVAREKAKAWDEGCRAAHQALGGQFIWFAPENPYRADTGGPT